MTLMEVLQALTATGAVGAMGLAATAFIRTRPAMKLADLQGEEALWARITALETLNERDREACEERVARVEARAEERLSAVEARLEAEVQILRHERNNVRQALNFLLTRIRGLGNDELTAIAAEVEDMITRGDAVIATEKAALPSLRARSKR